MGDELDRLPTAWLEDVGDGSVGFEDAIKIQVHAESPGVVDAVTAVWPPIGPKARRIYNNLHALSSNGFETVAVQAKLCLRLAKNVIDLQAELLLAEVYKSFGWTVGTTAYSVGKPEMNKGWVGITRAAVAIVARAASDPTEKRIQYIYEVKMLEFQNAVAWSWLKTTELNWMDRSTVTGGRAVPDKDGKAIQTPQTIHQYEAGFNRVLGKAQIMPSTLAEREWKEKGIPIHSQLPPLDVLLGFPGSWIKGDRDTIAYRNAQIALIMADEYGTKKASKEFAENSARLASSAVVLVGASAGRLGYLARSASMKIADKSGLSEWTTEMIAAFKRQMNNIGKDVEDRGREWIITGVVASLLAAVVYTNWKTK